MTARHNAYLVSAFRQNKIISLTSDSRNSCRLPSWESGISLAGPTVCLLACMFVPPHTKSCLLVHLYILYMDDSITNLRFTTGTSLIFTAPVAM